MGQNLVLQRVGCCNRKTGDEAGCKFQPTSSRSQLFVVLFCVFLMNSIAGTRDPFLLPFPRCVSKTIAAALLFSVRVKAQTFGLFRRKQVGAISAAAA